MEKTTNDSNLPSSKDNETLTLPVMEEAVHVGKEERTSGRVWIRKDVISEPVHLHETLSKENIDIERIVKNTPVEDPPSAYFEGDTLVVPILEETIEIRKKLILKEEIHIHKVRTAEDTTIETSIRKERVHIERNDDPDDTRSN